ncbi:MAG: 16S rRNA (uracil(1498)-N(3))-methyltransferase [Brachymonas denitrificans]
MPRFHCPVPLAEGDTLSLPAGAARHVQVLRMQPGDAITLFHGGLAAHLPAGQPRPSYAQGSFEAVITRMGRSEVEVRVGAQHDVNELPAPRVHLLSGVPANDRMDWLVEKAAELGVASIRPLMTERSVLRLKGERAEKKQAHWQAVAVSACEQSGRTRVPELHPVSTLAEGVQAADKATTRWVLSLSEGSQPLAALLQAGMPEDVYLLSGPEGGLSTAEEALAIAQGFLPLSLGRHVLRAETAPLAALACLMLR